MSLWTERPAGELNLKLSHGRLHPQEKSLCVYMCHSGRLRNVSKKPCVSQSNRQLQVLLTIYSGSGFVTLMTVRHIYEYDDKSPVALWEVSIGLFMCWGKISCVHYLFIYLFIY